MVDSSISDVSTKIEASDELRIFYMRHTAVFSEQSKVMLLSILANIERTERKLVEVNKTLKEAYENNGY